MIAGIRPSGAAASNAAAFLYRGPFHPVVSNTHMTAGGKALKTAYQWEA
jgi:hypothetical protein